MLSIVWFILLSLQMTARAGQSDTPPAHEILKAWVTYCHCAHFVDTYKRLISPAALFLHGGANEAEAEVARILSEMPVPLPEVVPPCFQLSKTLKNSNVGCAGVFSVDADTNMVIKTNDPVASRLISTHLCRKGWTWVRSRDLIRLSSWSNYSIPGMSQCDHPAPRILWTTSPVLPDVYTPSASSPLLSNLFPGYTWLTDKGFMWETLVGYARQLSPRCVAKVAGGLLPLTYRLYVREECELFFQRHIAPTGQHNDQEGDSEQGGGAAEDVVAPAGCLRVDLPAVSAGTAKGCADVVENGAAASSRATRDSTRMAHSVGTPSGMSPGTFSPAPGRGDVEAGVSSDEEGLGMQSGYCQGGTVPSQDCTLADAGHTTGGGDQGGAGRQKRELGGGGDSVRDHPHRQQQGAARPLNTQATGQEGMALGGQEDQGASAGAGETTRETLGSGDRGPGAQGGQAQGEGWWIIKVTDSFAGKGMHLIVPSQARAPYDPGKYCPTCWLVSHYGPRGENCGRVAQQAPANNQRTREQRRHGLNLTQVVQRYIRDPLLIDGRKFHIRVYALVLSAAPLVVVFTHRPRDNYILITPYPYNASDWTDMDGHLTSGRAPPTDAARAKVRWHAATEQGGEKGGDKEGGDAAIGKKEQGNKERREAALGKDGERGVDEREGLDIDSTAERGPSAGPYVRPPRVFTDTWWTLGELDEYMSVERGLVTAGYVATTLVPQLQAAVVLSLRAMEARVASPGRRRNATSSNNDYNAGTGRSEGDASSDRGDGSSHAGGGVHGQKYLHYFQLLSFDFMLDERLRLTLLEVNHNPGLSEPAGIVVDLITLAQELFEAKQAGRWPVDPASPSATAAATLTPAGAGMAASEPGEQVAAPPRPPPASSRQLAGAGGPSSAKLAASSGRDIWDTQPPPGGDVFPGSWTGHTRPARTSMYARDILDLSRYGGELEMLMDGDWELTNVQGCGGGGTTSM